MNRLTLWLTSLALALSILSGCTVGPDYEPPRTEVPNSFIEKLPTTRPTPLPTTRASAATTQPVELVYWWKSFNDPLMDQLMAEAMRSSLDLQAATSRLREARFQR